MVHDEPMLFDTSNDPEDTSLGMNQQNNRRARVEEVEDEESGTQTR